ncbi:MAG: hypothetical protein A2X49_08545 [Lentisphaerae bacterium GWF2_52_8]|nr:MAG: hypothetical protein A2X49_08545 [Lentisphaerae bacterium GWF2_52_8]
MKNNFLKITLAFATASAFCLFGVEKVDNTVPGVETLLFDWHDATRTRDVPVKIYLPSDLKTPLPVIVLSHGLGGSREGYQYLGKYWAEHGYISVHVEHEGSNTKILANELAPMKAMKEAAANPANSINRPLDIKFAIDQLEKLNKQEGPLQKRLELSKIGLAGHSFGAYTALAVAGQVFIGPLGKELSFADPRIKAALIMSAPVNERQKQLGDRCYDKITIPCLHMTGTKDMCKINNTSVEERRFPYDHSQNSEQYLLVFEEGDHMVFSGPRFGREGKDDSFMQKIICEASTTFWDAYLKGAPGAKEHLIGKEFRTELGKHGEFEYKLKKELK